MRGDRGGATRFGRHGESRLKAVFAKLGVTREREVAAMIAPLLTAHERG